MPKEMSEETKAELCQMYRAGVPIWSIVNELSTTPQTVYKVLHANNVPMRGRGNFGPTSAEGAAAPIETEKQRAVREERSRHEKAREEAEMRRRLLAQECLLLSKAGMPATEIAAALLEPYYRVRHLLYSAGWVGDRGRPSTSTRDWSIARRYLREQFALGRDDVGFEELINETGVTKGIALLVMRSEALRMEYKPDSSEELHIVQTPARLTEIVRAVKQALQEDSASGAGVQLRLV